MRPARGLRHARRFDHIAETAHGRMYFHDVRSETDEARRRQRVSPKRPRHPPSVVPGKLVGVDPPRRSIPPPRVVVRHEPVDFLALRRTRSSKDALVRTRDIVREILAPASQEKSSVPAVNAIKERIATLAAATFQMQPPLSPVVYAPDPADEATAAAVRAQNVAATSELRQLAHLRTDVERACASDAAVIRSVLDDARANISCMYMFTPSFRLWTRAKTRSALERWQAYTAWHRAEEARLQKLTHHAVPIQRAFRSRRQAQRGRRDRLALRQIQWMAAVTIQAWLRRHVASLEVQRLREAAVAVALQSAWRGQLGRRRVRSLLRGRLRELLRQLSPTGSLYRLAAMYRGDTRATIAHFLSLAEDTPVALGSQPPPPTAPATIRQLHEAGRELQAFVASRQQEVAHVQRQHALLRTLRLSAAVAHDVATKTQLLNDAIARHHRASERLLMYKEDSEEKERCRAQTNAEGTALYRHALRERRAEKEACLAMHMQEMQTRHYVAEERWRTADLRRRLGEVNKVDAWRQAQENAAAADARQLVSDLAEKRAEAREAAARARQARLAAWQIKTEEDAKWLHARMAAREEAQRQEKAARRAVKCQRQAAQLQRSRELARRRQTKHEELVREEAARAALQLEDAAMRRLAGERKKAEEARLWAALREDAQRAHPDPLALDPESLPLCQQLEQERRGRLAMEREEAETRVVLAAAAKHKFFAAARVRKQRLEAERRLEAKALAAMEAEETRERARLAALSRAEEYARTLVAMQAADDAYNRKQAERLFEARCRKLMHDEEMRLHRLYTEVLHRERLRERKERHKMHNEELAMHRLLEELERQRLRALEKTQRVEMCVEDARAHQWRTLEAEGARIGCAIWRPIEDKTLQAYVVVYPTLLRWNVQFAQLVAGLRGDPPWPHVSWTPQVAEEEAPTEPTRAQELWCRVRYHYLKRTQALRTAQQGYAELSAGQLDKAQRTLRIAFRNGCKSAQLVRAIGKCYVQLYERHYRDHDLRMGCVWYTKASKRLELSISPTYLVEYAQALYLSGALQHAAEVLATVIKGFPTFAQLPRVIFRAAMLLLALDMHDQSKDYLLYLLEAPPPPWTDAELMFVIARLYFLDDDLKHAAFAFDDAYRRWKLQWAGSGRRLHYGSYKAWLADAGVWRELATKALHHREYVLAKDLFQQTIKRRVDEVARDVDAWSLDWFHLAQCHTGLRDRPSAAIAVRHWLEHHPYMDQLLRRCQLWPTGRWASMGLVPLPAHAEIEVDADPEAAAMAPPKTPLLAKRRRQYQQRHRTVKKQKKKKLPPKRTTAELREWTAVEDPNTHTTFYFHEKSFEVLWTRPV
ncbi:hypothetical protein ACHHYP_01500 [Achlya hypogyna]|uniref:WW domain-containing protein n=1 Tax=Achlya hypogyna TaxID=1202772 RepID=A0A1V9ZTF3_ACHHY|nr:hypothetical protein ACHHYP_01500 [Achlya hypogyna]